MTTKEKCLISEIEYYEKTLAKMTPEERAGERDEYGMFGLIRKAKKELEEIREREEIQILIAESDAKDRLKYR